MLLKARELSDTKALQLDLIQGEYIISLVKTNTNIEFETIETYKPDLLSSSGNRIDEILARFEIIYKELQQQ